MEADHEKRMREVVKQARSEIINNGSAGGTNHTVPYLSMTILMIELFNEKKTGMTGIERKDKDRGDENISRAMR